MDVRRIYLFDWIFYDNGIAINMDLNQVSILQFNRHRLTTHTLSALLVTITRVGEWQNEVGPIFKQEYAFHVITIDFRGGL